MELTKAERNLKIVCGILGIVFLGAEMVFLFLPEQLFEVINTLSSAVSDLPVAPYSTEKFWASLTNAMMLMIVYISFAVYQDVKKNINMVPILILGKFVSSVSGVLYFLVSSRYFAHLTVFITDFPIFLIVLYFYRQAKKQS